MRLTKKIGGFLLSLAIVLSLIAPSGSDAAKAKAPKFSKKQASVQVGKTIQLTLKNVSKKAKVKWSSKPKNIVKIQKATKKSAKIQGIRKGNAKVIAQYRLGKTKKVLSCKISVNKGRTVTVSKTPTTPVPTAPAASAPSESIAPSESVAPSESTTPDLPASPTPSKEAYKWVSTWGTAEEKCNTTENAMPNLPLEDSTVRQIIRVTTSGEKLRFRLSNQYGEDDVVIHSMHIAKQIKPDASTVDPATDTIVTVGGSETFSIPKGEVLITDPVDFPVDALDNIAISTYFGASPSKTITGHRGARATTYQVSGNQVSEETFTGFKTTTSWFFLADASIWSPEKSKAVVCFGDSITDGYGTDASYLGKKPDSYTRWIDYFAKRLQADETKKHISLINEGIGTNSILGSYPTDAGKDRFARDLLEHDGVAYCIILFGVNDLNQLSNTSKFDQLLPEYEKMIALCHENGIKVYGAPILPFGKSNYYSEASGEVRNMINNWMRSEESNLDGIIDFESAVADPNDPNSLLEQYTHSDGLHPYDGYEVMADAIDLAMFD